MPKLENNKGELTEYGLRCGYVQRQVRDGIKTDLWCEHECFHVRQIDEATGARILWESFGKVSEAKQRYKELTAK